MRKEEYAAKCWQKLNSCHRALYPIGLVALSELSDAHNRVPASIKYYGTTVTATICSFAKGDAKDVAVNVAGLSGYIGSADSDGKSNQQSLLSVIVQVRLEEAGQYTIHNHSRDI